jgi:nucleoside-diphosphate-sugar epimerase
VRGAPADILVTGAAGFIGRALMTELRRAAPAARLLGVSRSDIDLAGEREVDGLFAAVLPKTVVHLAASMERDDRALQERDTFVAGSNVVRAAAANGTRRLLAAGSIEELGDQSGILTRACAPSPRTPYGSCKVRLREVAAAEAGAAGMHVDWFRPFVVYGPGQRGPMLIPYAMRSAVADIPGAFSVGAQQRDFLYVGDLARWIVSAILEDPPPADAPLTVHHVGTAVATSVAGVVQQVAALFPGWRYELGARPPREGEPSLQVAPSPEGTWRPRVSLEDGLAATAEWWRLSFRP